MVEAEIQTEEYKNACGYRFRETAVEIHGLIDPITVAEIPDEAAEIAEGCSLSQIERAVCFTASEKCP
jgi:hypothetical protein